MNIRFQIALLAAAAAFARPARAGTTFINWTAPGVTFSSPASGVTVITGTTVGAAALPFEVTIATSGTAQQVGVTPQLGGMTNPLQINHPAPRDSSTVSVVTITLFGVSFTNTTFTIGDLDRTPQGWVDLVQVLTSGAVLTAVDPNAVQVTGQQALAIGNFGQFGDIPPGSTQGNVDVSIAGPTTSVVFQFLPGPRDRFGANQLIGLSNLSFDVPEPMTAVLAGVGLAALALRRWQHTRRTANESPPGT